jgi:hypothetical protein
MSLLGTDMRRVQLFAYPPEEAARALLARQLDAVVLLTGWESPTVRALARTPDITLLQFARADALVALEPRFSKLVFPRGVADLAADRPPQDTTLIAAKASVVVRSNLHPALQYLLVRAAMETQSGPGMFQHAGEFPAAEAIDMPLSDEARHLYRSGPSFLQRSLPFWLAVLVQRVLIVVLPVAGIMYPLWSVLPRVYHWQMERRILRLYADLIALERDLRGDRADGALLRRLDELDHRVLELKLPTTFSAMKYTLTAHIRVLRERLRGSAQAGHAAAAPGRREA